MRLFSGRELKLYFLILGIGTLLAVTITLLVVLFQQQSARAEEQSATERVMREGEIDMTDVMIPHDFRRIWNEQWHPYRGPLENWSWEQVGRYWTSPEELLLDYLEEKNTETVENIFDSTQ